MPEKLKTAIIVTALALAFWVFAEAESLDNRSLNARLELAVPPPDRDNLRLELETEFQGRIAVEVRGPRAALDNVARFFSTPIELTPDQAGLAIDDGPFSIDLAELVQQLPQITAANVEVISVRPGTLSGSLLRLDTIDLPISTQLRGVQADATPTISPPTATVRIPDRLPDNLRDSIRAVATAAVDNPENLPPGETISVRAPITLDTPADLTPGDADHITLLNPDTASIAFTVRSTNASADVDAILWATLPAGQTGQYNIDVNPADRVIPVTVNGPTDAVARIESGEWPIIGIVALDAAELLESAVAKDLRWFALVGGGLQALPPSVQVDSEKSSVNVEISPRDEAP